MVELLYRLPDIVQCVRFNLGDWKILPAPNCTDDSVQIPAENKMNIIHLLSKPTSSGVDVSNLRMEYKVIMLSLYTYK